MNVKDTLLTYITTQLLNNKSHIQLGPDDNLLLSGLIDSHGVMRLVKHMEHTFAITVMPSEVTLKNFKTVSAIAAYVYSKTGAAG